MWNGKQSQACKNLAATFHAQSLLVISKCNSQICKVDDIGTAKKNQFDEKKSVHFVAISDLIYNTTGKLYG